MAKKTEDKGICILGFKGNNFMRLELVELQLNGGNLVIGGDNEQGKSSLLNAFWVALQGADAMKDLEISRPVRDGEKNASITLVLGPAGECLEMVKGEDGTYSAPETGDIFFVTRKWVGENMYLEVTTRDGAKYPSPQKMLDALVGKMFDPFEFSLLKGAEQKALLMKIVDLGAFNLDDYAVERKTLYDKRTEVNREVTRLEALVKSKAGTFEGAPDSEISASSILAEQEAAQSIIKQNDKKRDELQSLTGLWQAEKKEITDAEAYILSIEAKIEELQKHLSDARANKDGLIQVHTAMEQAGKALNVEVKALIDPDMTVFSGKLQDLERLNALVRNRVSYQSDKMAYDIAVEQSKGYTDSITALDQVKESALSAAKFPIDGLSLDDTGITFNKIPFGQCSTEEKMRICVSIAMSLSPRLKVIRISRGESLDAKNFKVISEMCAAEGYQVLMERVGDPGEMGIVIEAGKVKEV